jgi:hypothetical protein
MEGPARHGEGLTELLGETAGPAEAGKPTAAVGEAAPGEQRQTVI